MNPFHLRLLGLFEKHELHDSLSWSVDGDIVSFYVICNDLFDWAWASADAEDITPENIDILEQALNDVASVSSYDVRWGVTLFATRVRKMRPQRCAYPSLRALWPLFDACGPERPGDLTRLPGE